MIILTILYLHQCLSRVPYVGQVIFLRISALAENEEGFKKGRLDKQVGVLACACMVWVS